MSVSLAVTWHSFFWMCYFWMSTKLLLSLMINVIDQSKNFTSNSKIPMPVPITLNDDSNSGLIHCGCYKALCTRAPKYLCQRSPSPFIPNTGPWKGPIFFTRKTNCHHQMVSCCQGYLESSKHAGAPTPYRGDSPTMVLGLICTHPKANPQGEPLFACSCSRVATFSK